MKEKIPMLKRFARAMRAARPASEVDLIVGAHTALLYYKEVLMEGGYEIKVAVTVEDQSDYDKWTTTMQALGLLDKNPLIQD